MNFNKLRTNEKWKRWKSADGSWACGHCGAILTDGPVRAEPFPGYSIVCEECEGELTRRTGGGQLDPFGWVLVENPGRAGELPAPPRQTDKQMNIYQKHKARLKHELITNQTHEEDEETIAKYNACEIAEEIDKKILSTMFNEKE